MSYCTRCGAQLQDGVPHECAVQQTAAAIEPTNPQSRPSGNNVPPVNVNLLLGLFRNPFQAAAFGSDKLLYGIIGLAASVLFYFLAGLSSYRSYNFAYDIFNTLSSRLGFDFGGVFRAYFIGGLLSLAVFVAAFWLMGQLFGSVKVDFKEAIAKLGSIQVVTAGGWLAAAVFTFLIPSIGGLLMTATKGITLVITLLVSLEAFQIPNERRFAFILSSIGGYLFVDLVIRLLLSV